MYSLNVVYCEFVFVKYCICEYTLNIVHRESHDNYVLFTQQLIILYSSDQVQTQERHTSSSSYTPSPSAGERQKLSSRMLTAVYSSLSS